MSSEYDQITAFHYSAFRPELHSSILNEVLGDGKKYQLGLDIGCGTGQSSIALANHCEMVIGIEPSKEMLNKSIGHPSVEYFWFDGKSLAFEYGYFDVITFAGSLFYAKSQELLNEVVRVGKPAATILVYDFEILLDEVFTLLHMSTNEIRKSDYNHQVNFSGLNQDHLLTEKELSKSQSVAVSHADLAHLLLSSKENYNMLLNSLGAEKLYHKVSQKLQAILKGKRHDLQARWFATIYRITK